MDLGQEANLNGFVPFPETDAWRADISGASVSSWSPGVIGLLAPVGLHADFGAGLIDGTSFGIPYNVVSGAKPVKITYQAYGSESDPGPMPIPAGTLIESFPMLPSYADRHVLVLNRDNCYLYELWHGKVQGDGSWTADSGVVWDLLNDSRRPIGWTSTDAAGLPVFPGLARYDEVAAGEIKHALRFTVKFTRPGYLFPATHDAPNVSNPPAAMEGMRFRLKASFDISSYPPQSRVILAALKKYGMIVADNGSNMYISGTPDSRWDNDDLHALSKVHASDFEVVNSPATALAAQPLPTIQNFSASSSTTNGTGKVVLHWAATNASTVIITPDVGVVRDTAVTVNPTQSTTYTIYASNSAGRVTKTLSVSVK